MSSAYRAFVILWSESLGMSFTYRENSIGPSAEPCRIPASVMWDVDVSLLARTWNFLFVV